MENNIEEYFQEIEKQVELLYSVAEKARSQGLDPEDNVEILLAKNMAERVKNLISTVAPQIKETFISRLYQLEQEYGFSNWRVALKIAEEVALEKFCSFSTQKEAIEVGIRTGLAYLTVGVVSSPLEGFVELRFKKTKENKDYFCLMYSGPIRSAGGTAAAVSVLIADYLRKKFNFAEYDPTEEEIKRIITEISDYHERVTNLQYYPSEEELYFLLSKLPVQIDGHPSEKIEVSNYKDLKRIETNRLRNGVCLVIAEALAQKSKKLWAQLIKWGNDFNLSHWAFLEKFLEIQKRIKAKEKTSEEKGKILPDYTFIKDLVAGRPILAKPIGHGGFRLRYGRSRTSGFSSDALHPATMIVLNGFIATGTQLKTERPGKSTAITVCDSIEGPIVKLKDGSVIQLSTEKQALEHKSAIEEILYLGDILINYGDFLNRAHKLVPPGYCEEWYALEVEKTLNEKSININELQPEFKELFNSLLKDPIKTEVNMEQALFISKTLDVPLHPKYTYHWAGLSKEQFISLLNWMLQAKTDREAGNIKKIRLPVSNSTEGIIEDQKRVMELIGVQHKLAKDFVILENDNAMAFAANIGCLYTDLSKEEIEQIQSMESQNVLELVNKISDVLLRDKSGTFIGARMGRPEKAKSRKLIGSPNALFPVGQEGGKFRSFQAALKQKKVTAQFPSFFCKTCGRESIYKKCIFCGNVTEQHFFCKNCNTNFPKEELEERKKTICAAHQIVNYKLEKIAIQDYFENALNRLGIKKYPELIKGIKGTSSKDHIPENLVKGILRAVYKLYVNKDGTIRYDMSELGITHFKPKEISTPIDQLKSLGYKIDIHSKPLINEAQVLELFPQDVILPACTEALEDGAQKVFLRIANFVDELLVKFYNQKAVYNCKSYTDLVGHLVLGLSPHTSAGVVGRIIGFSKTQGFFAHPYFHSLMRRDLDGDEASAVLLMDALLNFSRRFLPNNRGATQDTPLILTSHLIPAEVDDMVFDMDIQWKYPLEFYEAAMSFKEPKEIKIETCKDRLAKKPYSGFGFTHQTEDINSGVRCSSYKSLLTMEEKVQGQMELAEKIRAVDENDVARLVIERHFIRDIKGNLRRFSMQQFRCVNCNEKYRRPPLCGYCPKCKGNLIFTVSEGTVIKYLGITTKLVEKYDVPSYLRQTIKLVELRIGSVFGREEEKQEGLAKWV